MKKRELKNLAKKIAEYEMIIQNSTDPDERDYAKDEIFRLSNEIRSFEELDLLDELVQEYINKLVE